MDTLVFNKKKFTSLKKYKLDKGISSTECELYFYSTINGKKLLKIFDMDEGLYFGNKLLTLNTLVDNKGEINIEELIMPEKLVVVDNHVIGFSMPFIDNINLKLVLDDINIPILQKIDFLKQIGRILECIHKIKVEGQGFYLGDVHESNFIIDTKTGKVKVVDLDGCKIVNNRPGIIKYLGLNDGVAEMPYKYYRTNGDLYIPDANTDILCYNFMILNTISGGKVNMYGTAKYYLYLNYLRSLGFGYDLLDCFSKIYIGQNNEMPTKFLNQIPKNITNAHCTVFEKVLNKK